ncbi:MAG: hypothetical protein M3357_01260 [Actinomycetota bacterium]|jgi:hypothetical protein|nr:hypothetical protein [Actinomycetota bacterium]
MKEEGTATGASTLTEVIDRFEADGYGAQFGAREGAEILCFTCRDSFPAGDADIEALERLEGASDPDDMAAVAALRCPRCGARGTIVLKYGPESAPEDGEVLLALGDRAG